MAAVLAGHWTFDASTIETDGTARRCVDKTSGMAALLDDGVDVVPARHGEALRFDGSVRAVIPADPRLVFGPAFSVAFRVNVAAGPTGEWRTILYKPVAEGDARGVGVWLYPDGMRARVQLFTTKGPEFADCRRPLVPGAWTRLAFAVDPDEIYFYVDGEFDVGVPLPHPVVTAAGPLHLGGGFAGMLDDLRIYSSALTAPEVRALGQ